MTTKTARLTSVQSLITALLLCLFLLPTLTYGTEKPADPKQTQMEELRLLLDKHPADPTLLYNYGVALYQAKQYKQAAEQFAKSSSLEPDKTRQAEADYNQGRALFAQSSLLKTPQEIKTKKNLLKRAGATFQQSLEHNPELQNARQGLQEYRKEMAKIKKLEKQRRQSQNNKGDSKSKEGEKNKDNSRKEQQNSQGNTQKQLDQASKSQQDLNKQTGNQQNPGETADQQKALRKKLEELQQKLQEDQNKTDLSQQLQKAIDKQKEAEQSLQKGQTDKAKKQQEEAAKALQQAARQSRQNPEENNSPPAITAPPDQQQDEPVPQLQEPSLVKDILENERKLHELRRQQMRKTRPYHGKDW